MIKKRPTSYGNSNSVQVFSAYTFAAKGRRIGQVGWMVHVKGALSLDVGRQKLHFQFMCCRTTPFSHICPLLVISRNRTHSQGSVGQRCPAFSY